MNFKLGFRFLSIAALSIVLIGCFGGKSKSTIKGAPKWFEKPPTKSGYIYATGTAKSSDYQQAINSAREEAKSELASSIKSEVKGNIEKVFEENLGSASPDVLNVFSSTINSTFSTLLQDWKIAKKEVVTEGKDYFRAYVLIEWDEGKAQKRVLDKIKAKKEIYDAVKANDMIKEMEEKVDKYCERYGCD